MKFEPTLIVALITAVSAIASPVVTAVINNRHEYKMRKLELIQNQKIKAIQGYTTNCSNYLSSNSNRTREEYYKSYGEIFLYVNKHNWKIIESLHSEIENGSWDSALKNLRIVCQSLSREMET